MDDFCEIIDFLAQIEILPFFEKFGSFHFKFAIKFTGEYTFVGHIKFLIFGLFGAISGKLVNLGATAIPYSRSCLYSEHFMFKLELLSV